MVYDYFDKYTFLCEMFDEQADAMKILTLNFFPFDNSVQIIDSEKGKTLLRRVNLPPLKLDMLQIGNTISIFSKVLLITDCAPLTQRTIFKNCESTFAIIKPVSPTLHGKIMKYIMKKGFRIVRLKNGKVTTEFALELYRGISGHQLMPVIIDYVTSGEVIGLELVGVDAVRRWRKCLGATDPKLAAPGTLRALYGESKLKNVAHGCDNAKEVKIMLELFFGFVKGVPRIPFRATFKNCSCCIIKPHAITDGNLGSIIEQIATSGKFFISAMASFSLNLPNAQEFYEIYKGVYAEYEAMAVHLTEGKCVVLEIKSIDPEVNVVSEFRKLCGPRDPELCRQLYPDTVRALYGKNILFNAVHCTDLPEDGEQEVEYFFKHVSSETSR